MDFDNQQGKTSQKNTNHYEKISLDTYQPKKPANKDVKKYLKPMAVIVIILIIGILVWEIIPSKSNEAKTGQDSDQSQAPASINNGAQNKQPDKELAEKYTNDFLRLSFNHPKSWSVKDENDLIIAKSEDIKYTTRDGLEKSGFFKIYIKQSASSSDSKYLGKAYANENSEQISYTNPSAGQRKKTYLTNFGLDGTNNFAFFLVQGNFNLNKGDSLGPKYGSEAEALIIAGGFGSTDLGDDPLATNLISIEDFKQNPSYKIALEIIKTINIK